MPRMSHRDKVTWRKMEGGYVHDYSLDELACLVMRSPPRNPFLPSERWNEDTTPISKIPPISNWIALLSSSLCVSLVELWGLINIRNRSGAPSLWVFSWESVWRLRIASRSTIDVWAYTLWPMLKDNKTTQRQWIWNQLEKGTVTTFDIASYSGEISSVALTHLLCQVLVHCHQNKVWSLGHHFS